MNQFFKILVLGPLFYLRNSLIIGVGLFILIFVLTVMTQVGGIILWASFPILDKIRIHHRVGKWTLRLVVLFALYMISILIIVPLLARMGGRVPLPWFATPQRPLKPANIGFCLLARNYVRPPVRNLIERISVNIATMYPGSTVRYLDANFPFINGFPLLPHLNHKDGKKLDLAYFYRNEETKKTLHITPSPIGYWAYEKPKNNESQPCENTHSWLRWDFKWLQPVFSFAEIDPIRTKALLNALISSSDVQKIFIESHLKSRLKLNSGKVRFQGCYAARHDDHIHFQIW